LKNAGNESKLAKMACNKKNLPPNRHIRFKVESHRTACYTHKFAFFGAINLTVFKKLLIKEHSKPYIQFTAVFSDNLG
jgi:hypothetical protein